MRLSLIDNGKKLKGDVIGSKLVGTRRSVLADDKIYWRDRIHNLDGSELQQGLPFKKDHEYWTSNLVLGKSFLSITHAKGIYQFRDRSSHKVIGTGTLPIHPPGGHKTALRMQESKYTGQFGSSRYNKEVEAERPWMVIGGSFPFATCDRLYFRSFDYIYCVGK